MMGTCYYPYTNSIVSGPCRKDNCETGYHGFCTKSVYTPKQLGLWMTELAEKDKGFLDRGLNTIPIPGSHDAATYSILKPDKGMDANHKASWACCSPTCCPSSAFLALRACSPWTWCLPTSSRTTTTTSRALGPTPTRRCWP
jgi:hypothetical protein